MSGRAAKRKGDRLERLVVDTFRKANFEAKKVPLSGAAPDYPGDVIVTLGDVEYTLECKSRADFKTLYGWLEPNNALVIKGDRQEPLLVIRLRDALELASKG